MKYSSQNDDKACLYMVFPVDVSSVNLKSIPWQIRVNYEQNVPSIRKMEIVGKNNPEHYPGTTAVTGDHIPIP